MAIGLDREQELRVLERSLLAKKDEYERRQRELEAWGARLQLRDGECETLMIEVESKEQRLFQREAALKAMVQLRHGP